MLFKQVFAALCSIQAILAFNPVFSPFFSTQGREDIARQAVQDAFLLAWSAQNFPQPGVFASYFPATLPIATVNALFARIVDPTLAANAITGTMTMRSLTIDEADPTDPTDRCNIAPTPLAYITQTGPLGNGASVSLCEGFFDYPAITGAVTTTVTPTYGKTLPDKELSVP